MNIHSDVAPGSGKRRYYEDMIVDGEPIQVISGKPLSELSDSERKDVEASVRKMRANQSEQNTAHHPPGQEQRG